MHSLIININGIKRIWSGPYKPTRERQRSGTIKFPVGMRTQTQFYTAWLRIREKKTEGGWQNKVVVSCIAKLPFILWQAYYILGEKKKMKDSLIIKQADKKSISGDLCE